jgi:hypothetical protein
MEVMMNRKPTLENLDLELLAAIQREHQAEMRREARQAHLRGGQASREKGMRGALKRKLALALAAAALLVWWLVQVASAMGG